MTISEASKQYGVPRTTLSDRINHKESHDAKIGRPAALTKEEASLSSYVSYMYDRRFPIDCEQVIRLWLANTATIRPRLRIAQYTTRSLVKLRIA